MINCFGFARLKGGRKGVELRGGGEGRGALLDDILFTCKTHMVSTRSGFT